MGVAYYHVIGVVEKVILKFRHFLYTHGSICVMHMRKHMWSVYQCSSTLTKHKCRTVDQPWSVLESIYDFSVENGSLYNESRSSYHSYGILS